MNEEAQLDHRTAEICLGEVSAAKGYQAPNFLITVCDRYGYNLRWGAIFPPMLGQRHVKKSP